MKIGCNGKFLSSERTTGVERAAGELLRRLARLEGGHEWLLFHGGEVDGKRTAEFPGMRAIPSWRLTKRWKKNLWEQNVLPRLARRERVDLLLNPANMAPAGFAANLLFLYDVSFVVDPSWHSRAFGTYYRMLAKRLVRRAKRLIVPSNNTARDIVAHYDIPEDRISVVPLGVDAMFCPSRDASRGRDILTVGSIEPRKNLRRLVEAFIALKRERAIEGRLIVVGTAGKNFRSVRCDIEGYEKEILFKGYVSDDELVALYRRAALFVYPSLYEGFGLPVLEAMACGCPIVTSNVSSLPEVAGDAAMLVDPRDPRAIAGAIERMMKDNGLRASYVARGLERARRFTWDRSATMTMKVITSLKRES